MKRQTAIKRTPIEKNPLKKCISTKTKGYGCRRMSKDRRFGLCKECYPLWLVDTPEGNKVMADAVNPIKQKRASFDEAKKQIVERNSISYLLTNAKNAVHAFIRERDKGKPCISCNGLWKSDHQCGHFYKAETFSTLRFDEKNLSGQCVGCNIHNDGNESGYRVGILNRYGEEHLKYLDDKASKDHQQTHKWDRMELDKIRKLFTAKLALIKTK